MSRRLLLGTLAAGAAALALLAVRWPATRSIAGCPDGARLVADRLPGGTQERCERVDAGGRRVPHGPYLARYPGGRTRLEGTYRDGLREGRWTFWHSNGRKSEEGELHQGREEGRWARWYANGEPREAGEYREGVRQDRWTFWYESGRVERAGEYRDGAEIGRWARWNVKGEPCQAGPASG